MSFFDEENDGYKMLQWLQELGSARKLSWSCYSVIGHDKVER